MVVRFCVRLRPGKTKKFDATGIIFRTWCIVHSGAYRHAKNAGGNRDDEWINYSEIVNCFPSLKLNETRTKCHDYEVLVIDKRDLLMYEDNNEKYINKIKALPRP